MTLTIGWVAAGATHIGRVRKGNEDAFRMNVEDGVFLVADGMGGHAAGEVASGLAAATALEELTGGVPAGAIEERLNQVFLNAHRRIVESSLGAPETEGMGTTLTVALLGEDGALHIGHIGDSRVYHLSGEELRQLTRDHTWVQQEIDGGRLRAEAARTHPLSHILNRVLTTDEPGTPDVSSWSVRPGDVLLLCTDGLHNMVNAQRLLEILSRHEPPSEVTRRLIHAANRAGGFDNVTAIVVQIVPPGGD